MIRRTFIKDSLVISSAACIFPSVLQTMNLNNLKLESDKITDIAVSLLEKWCQGLYKNQTHSPGNKLTDGGIYTNISDLGSKMTSHESKKGLIIETKSRLVNGDQETPEADVVEALINYTINNDSLTIELGINKKPIEGKLHFIFPLVCSSLDKIDLLKGAFIMRNSQGSLLVKSNYLLQKSLPPNKRVYNFVPGLQAYPIEIECSNLHKENLLLRFLEKSIFNST